MNGIACAGNWIVDHIKVIDCWPRQGELVNILSDELGVGGSPTNVLTDLRRLGFPAPTWALGCTGDDEYGRILADHCRENDIDASLIRVLSGVSTSYTDVMTLADDGQRTFFHARGANARFGPEHVNMDELESRAPLLFHLGYLLLLDAMDAADEQFGTVAAKLLRSVRERGIQTSIDVVSEALGRFTSVVRPVLPHVDHCILNEYEAEHTTGFAVRSADGTLDREAMDRAARGLFDLGVRMTVVVHCPEGGLYMDAGGHHAWSDSLALPDDLIVSTVGAGDAFCAGMLYGIHERWEPDRCLSIANAAAAMCLGARNTTDGVRSLEETETFARQYCR